MHIQRRQFLAGSVAAAASTGTALTGHAAPKLVTREFYELRIYRADSAEKQQIVGNYIEAAFLPALERMGLGPIGVFQPIRDLAKEAEHNVIMLIPYRELAALGERNLKLDYDETFQDAAKTYFGMPQNNPPYKRIESRLMQAFAGMPVMEQPSKSDENNARIFEIRIYESRNEHKARLKVEMFNEGEIDIMRDVELGPVFYGETLISSDLPNLTYMLWAESLDAHQEHWDAFRKHPDWLRMKELKKYKDTVSKITSILVEPTKYSQV